MWRLKIWLWASLDGPFSWASLAPENEACKSGKNQSPINIGGEISAANSRPVLDIPTGEVIFENLGMTIEVLVNGTTSYAGTNYRLVQFHMHTPSEHHVNDEYFPAITQPGTTTAIPGGIDFADVISTLKTSDIHQYSGSLTTPPCAEGVTFLIVNEPLAVSVNDFNAIKKIVKFNSRFIQNAIGDDNIISLGATCGNTTTPPAATPAEAKSANADLLLANAKIGPKARRHAAPVHTEAARALRPQHDRFPAIPTRTPEDLSAETEPPRARNVANVVREAAPVHTDPVRAMRPQGVKDASIAARKLNKAPRKDANLPKRRVAKY